MKLNHMAVKNAKPRDKDYKLTDGNGLYLLVTRKGQRYWRMNYRFAGKQKTLALGVYPDVSLSDARRLCSEAREAIGQDRDPGHERKIAKLTRGITAGNSFRALAAELIHKMEQEGRAKVTIEKTEWVFGFAYPFIGDRPINEITAPEVLAVLKTLEARGRYETARRLRSKCGQVFRLAIATGRAERDPTADLRGAIIAPQVKHRAAITNAKEVGPFLNAIEGFTGHSTTKIALKLLALTYVRPGEIRRAEWDEFDLQSATWTIPAEKMKMRRPHKVPLSRQALALLEKLSPLTGQSRYLFPAVNSWIKPMSDNTLNGALRRLGYTKEEVTAHGFRAMAATLLNEMNRWPSDVIERQLAHQDKNAVRRAYTHGVEYWPQRVEMMQVWADYLDNLQTEALSRAEK